MKRNKFFSKRRLASFVALALSVNTLSVTAWAGSFSQLQDLIDANESVVLGENYTYDAEKDSEHTTININTDVNLNLNGWTITGSENNSVITVNSGASLTLENTKDETVTANVDETTGEFATGEITGGGGRVMNGNGFANGKDKDWNSTNCTVGGGVYVNGGTFNMKGGAITGNNANLAGGGVYVDGPKGTFNMSGGSITNNTTKIAEENGNRGGAGVAVRGGATFNMTGGEISHNEGAASGGGVYVKDNGSTFIMSGDSIITENKALNNGEGGGVHVGDGATFTMKGGKITNNTSNSWFGGGGVRVWNATFEMSGGEITGNKAAGKASENNNLHTIGAGDKGNTSKPAVTGGKIGEDAERFIAESVQCKHTVNGVIYVNKEHKGVTDPAVAATCKDPGKTEGSHCSECGAVLVKQEDTPIATDKHTVVIDAAKAPTCEGTGLTEGSHCSVCGHIFTEQTVIPASHKAETFSREEPTCAKVGHEEGTKCSVCGLVLSGGEEISATGNHSFGESGNWSDWVTNAEGTEQTRTGTHTCMVCGQSEPVSESREVSPVNPGDGDDNGGDTDDSGNTDDDTNSDIGGGDDTNTGDDGNTGDTGTTEPAEPTPEEPTPEEPATPDTPDEPAPETPAGGTVIPDDETPLAADPTAAPAAAADTTVITDDPIPLAGLITRAQLLAELYRYEQRPEVVLPEEFDFAEHEYALAICWGLDNALESHTEDDPYLPDDLLTVGVLREVLVNFVAYKGIEDLEFTVEGEDDELVMDLDVRLAAFYELLETAEA